MNTHGPVNSVTAPSPVDSDQPLSVTVREYWTIVVRKKWYVLGSIVAGITLGVVLCVVGAKRFAKQELPRRAIA